MPAGKLNVMHLIADLEIGGAQEVVRTLVEYLALDNCRPVVCTFKDGPLRQEIERAGIKVKVLPPRRYGIVALPLFVVDMFRLWRILAQFIKEHQIDVVQTHLLRSLDFLVLLLRYTTRLRAVLWTFHSANFVLTETHLSRHRWLLKPKRWIHNRLYRLASPMVDGLIAVSGEVKAAMVQTIGLGPDKITVIYNGVDLKRYTPHVDKTLLRRRLGLPETAGLLVMIGTLKEAKGHRYMIEAMALLVQSRPDVQLLLVGDGELRQELQGQVNGLHLNDRIHFLGSRQDVPDLLAAGDIFVLPSLWEGLSIALLEAMATGLPIVASEVSGTVQVIIPGQTGILVPPGEPDRLAAAIGQLLANPGCAQALGAAAKERVTVEFTAQKQAAEHLALYHQLLSQC